MGPSYLSRRRLNRQQRLGEIDLCGVIHHEQIGTKALETELHGPLKPSEIHHAEKTDGSHKSDRGDQHHGSKQATADVAKNEFC